VSPDTNRIDSSLSSTYPNSLHQRLPPTRGCSHYRQRLDRKNLPQFVYIRVRVSIASTGGIKLEWPTQCKPVRTKRELNLWRYFTGDGPLKWRRCRILLASGVLGFLKFQKRFRDLSIFVTQTTISHLRNSFSAKRAPWILKDTTDFQEIDSNIRRVWYLTISVNEEWRYYKSHTI
jgi:hypothetical protein